MSEVKVGMGGTFSAEGGRVAASDLAASLRAVGEKFPRGTFWRHHKGGVYEVVGACVREADLAPQVLYLDNATGVIYSRPADDWLAPAGDGPIKAARFTRVG